MTLFAYDYNNDDEYDSGKAVVGAEAFCRIVNLVTPTQSLIILRHLYEAKRGANIGIFPGLRVRVMKPRLAFKRQWNYMEEKLQSVPQRLRFEGAGERRLSTAYQVAIANGGLP